MKKSFSISVLCFAFAACAVKPPLRHPGAVWMKDIDKNLIAKPPVRDDYKYADILEKGFFYPIERLTKPTELLPSVGLGAGEEAHNVTDFDEVPDSTWFTNRIGREKMSPAELAKGPNQDDGPDVKGTWTILSGKTVGLTPGLFIEDARKVRYLIKFDPKGYQELASGADMISTKYFHAIGYNVSENHIAVFDPKILKISPKATRKDAVGRKHPFKEEDLAAIMKKLEPLPDGRYRALASRLLPGEPLGPFAQTGTRRGDTNDRIPHQYRRELRGYRVFCAFLNHQDSREANSLDMFLKTDGDKGYVKHNLIDFGSTLGSASVRPKSNVHLYDYLMNYARTMGTLAALGSYEPYWTKAENPKIPAVGMLESKLFRPDRWKPSYHNPMFLKMTDRDGFWATKILMKFTDKDIEAIVDQAKYSDPRARDLMVRILKERRDKIGRHWFGRVNPLDDFKMTDSGGGAHVVFEDLAVSSGLESAQGVRYQYRIINPENGVVIVPWRVFEGTSFVVAREEISALSSGKRYALQIQSKHASDKFWSPSVDLLVQSDPSRSLDLLGIHRRSSGRFL